MSYALLEEHAQQSKGRGRITDASEKRVEFENDVKANHFKMACGAEGKCYFTTSTGYIGRADRVVENSDLLAILFVSSTNFNINETNINNPSVVGGPFSCRIKGTGRWVVQSNRIHIY
jgi:hypothetical protein